MLIGNGDVIESQADDTLPKLAEKHYGDVTTRPESTLDSDYVNLLAQVANALDYAHQHDSLHRDIKPGNILLKQLDRAERPGEPPLRAVVTDFGLAKLLTDESEVTKTAGTWGTWAYMSPEQCAGKPKLVDHRSDLYSLGIVLYQLVTGRLPFDIETPVDAAHQHIHVAPP